MGLFLSTREATRVPQSSSSSSSSSAVVVFNVLLVVVVVVVVGIVVVVVERGAAGVVCVGTRVRVNARDVGGWRGAGARARYG